MRTRPVSCRHSRWLLLNSSSHHQLTQEQVPCCSSPPAGRSSDSEAWLVLTGELGLTSRARGYRLQVRVQWPGSTSPAPPGVQTVRPHVPLRCVNNPIKAAQHQIDVKLIHSSCGLTGGAWRLYPAATHCNRQHTHGVSDKSGGDSDGPICCFSSLNGQMTNVVVVEISACSQEDESVTGLSIESLLWMWHELQRQMCPKSSWCRRSLVQNIHFFLFHNHPIDETHKLCAAVVLPFNTTDTSLCFWRTARIHKQTKVNHHMMINGFTKTFRDSDAVHKYNVARQMTT